MNKEEITSIIETTLTSGDRIPGIFDLPKILGIKSELQACHSVDDILAIIEEHRDLITKVFGLSAEVIDSAVQKIKALEGV
jgi:hypothetical protein